MKRVALIVSFLAAGVAAHAANKAAKVPKVVLDHARNAAKRSSDKIVVTQVTARGAKTYTFQVRNGEPVLQP